jgi:arylsulfatase A-like enzyme
MMDILPTVTKLTGGRLPAHEIDGYDIWPLMADKRGAQSPRDTFYYYWQYELHAVRWGKWKLRLPHTDSQAPDPGQIGYGGKRGEVPPIKYGLALYNLEEDRGETTDVAAQHPDLVKRLLALAQQARTDLGDEITKQKGEKVRPPGDLRKAVR